MKKTSLVLAVAALARTASAAIWTEPTFGLCEGEEYRNGVYVYTDYVFDDHGADTDGSAGGDVAYPSDDVPYRKNGADMVELRVEPDAAAGVVRLGVRLNTLLSEGVPVIAIGIDDGTSAATLDWPFGAGVRASGVRWVVTLRAGGGTLTDLPAGASADVPVTVRNDTGDADRELENTLTAALPASALGLAAVPSSGTWRLHAAAGVWEGSGWHRGGGEAVPAPYDLAFVANETFSGRQDGVQSGILSAGDLGPAAGVVDFARFPSFAAPVRTGRMTRVYRTRYDRVLGEGVGTFALPVIGGLEDVAAPLGDSLLGLYLPYAVWIPPAYATLTPIPLFFEMHGFGGNHLGLGSWANGTIDVPAMAFSPNGRSGNNFYLAEGELDVMEGFDDVLAHYDVDRDRVYVSGISMGGFETYKLAVRYPDRFAAAVSLIGTGASEETVAPAPVSDAQGERVFQHRFPSGSREMLENVLNLPFRNFNGQIDWLVDPVFYYGDVVRFEQLGYDYQFSAFTKRHHETVPAYTNILFHQVLDGCQAAPAPTGCDPALDRAGGIVRDSNPARVVYKTYPFQFFPELGLVYDRAYWVSELVVRDASREGSHGMIDVTSRPLAAKLHGNPERIGPEARVFEPTGDPYEFHGLRRTATPEDAGNALDVSLVNLSQATLDLARAAIDESDFEVRIAGDGPASLRLVGGFSSADPPEVLRDGVAVPAAVTEDGRLVLAGDFSAPTTYRIRD